MQKNERFFIATEVNYFYIYSKQLHNMKLIPLMNEDYQNGYGFITINGCCFYFISFHL